MFSFQYKFRQNLSEIIRGYSSFDSPDFGVFYIKHLTNLDLAEIEYWNNYYLEEAKKNGIPTYEQKSEFIIKNGLWTQKEENKIKDYKKQMDVYESNKGNEFLKSKRIMWAREAEKLGKDIKYLEFKKQSLIKETAESIAAKKSNQVHINKSFFKDKDLTQPCFDKEQFDNLEDDKINLLFDIFNDYLSNFNTENLKKLAISPVFLNLFYLSSENIYEFYGKPVVYLTTYQTDLFGFGRYFKNMMSEYQSSIPKEILNDPDKMIEYVELNRNYKKQFPEEKESDGASLIGANKEDYAVLGIQVNDSLNKRLKEKGGHLSKSDLIGE